jgi:hypothetical protein
MTFITLSTGSLGKRLATSDGRPLLAKTPPKSKMTASMSRNDDGVGFDEEGAESDTGQVCPSVCFLSSLLHVNFG